MMKNPNAYPVSGFATTVRVTFEIMLDPVPGFGHTIEDHINLIFDRNSYVQSAEIEQAPDGEPNHEPQAYDKLEQGFEELP
jgi:hypothetical protein